MAAAAAVPPVPAAAAGERLPAALHELGDALRLAAQDSLLPQEVQELVGSWDARTQALVGALTGGAEGGQLQEAEAAAAAELLQPLLSEAFTADHPGLVGRAVEVGGTIAACCSDEALPLYFGPVGASLLGLFLSERSSQDTRSSAGAVLLRALGWPGCAAAVLSAAGGEGAVDALIAAAKREGDPQQGAFLLVATLAEEHDWARERAASADGGLLPIAVARMSAAAAGAASCDAVMAFHGPLLLLNTLTADYGPATVARAHALASPGLAAAAVDLLMALGSEEWGTLRQEGTAPRVGWVASWEEPEPAILFMLARLMLEGGAAGAAAFDALTSRGALPRVVALLRSPDKGTRHAASACLMHFGCIEGGCEALLLVPRAASELTAALRGAYAEGEDPSLTQSHAAGALTHLMSPIEGERVAEGLARAALAEGGAGSLLGALAGLLTASAYSDKPVMDKLIMFEGGANVLAHMLATATTKQLRLLPVLQRAPIAVVCVHALRHWLGEWTTARPLGDAFSSVLLLAHVVATLARYFTDEPGAVADTAATRAALREAPGMEGGLRRFLAWVRRQPQDRGMKESVASTKWLLRLPEVKAPAAAAVRQAAAATAAGAAIPAGATAGPAAAALTAAAAAAAAAPTPAAESLLAQQQPADSTIGGGGCSGEAAAQPRACSGCGKGEPEVRLLRCAGCKAQHYCGAACAKAHWPSHRAECRAVMRRALALPRS